MEFLEEFNKKFKYRKDRDQYGHRDAWYVMNHEPYHGDCEDYSLTLLFNLKDRKWEKFLLSLLLRESKICHCKGPGGGGHAVLRYKGRYIDNIQRKWCTKEYMENRGYKFSIWLYIPYQVVIKLVVGFLQTRKRKKI